MTVTEQTIDMDIEQSLVEHQETTTNKHRLTHLINPPDNLHLWRPGMPTSQIIDVALARGVAVVALCGFKFLPKHNPDKYPACEACIKIAGDLMREAGE